MANGGKDAYFAAELKMFPLVAAKTMGLKNGCIQSLDWTGPGTGGLILMSI